MNRNQSNRYNAFQKIKNFIVKYFDILSLYLPMSEELTDYDTENEKLNLIIEEQEKTITGITDEKEAAKVSLARVCSKYGRIASRWARKNKKKEELSILRRSFSSLFKLKPAEMIAACGNIRKVLFDNLAALVDYKILAAQIAVIDAAITEFEKLSNAPASAIGEREQSTTALDVQMDAVDGVVENMDDLMPFWSDTEAEMVADFEIAKKINDIGGRLTIAEFIILKEGNPVKGAVITDSLSKKTAVANALGSGTFTSIRQGTRDFDVNGNGSGSKTVNEKIIRGKKTVFTIDL